MIDDYLFTSVPLPRTNSGPFGLGGRPSEGSSGLSAQFVDAGSSGGAAGGGGGGGGGATGQQGPTGLTGEQGPPGQNGIVDYDKVQDLIDTAIAEATDSILESVGEAISEAISNLGISAECDQGSITIELTGV